MLSFCNPVTLPLQSFMGLCNAVAQIKVSNSLLEKWDRSVAGLLEVKNCYSYVEVSKDNLILKCFIKSL